MMTRVNLCNIPWYIEFRGNQTLKPHRKKVFSPQLVIHHISVSSGIYTPWGSQKIIMYYKAEQFFLPRDITVILSLNRNALLTCVVTSVSKPI